MQYGICNLSIIPVRLEPSDTSEMVTQALYGDEFKILKRQKPWLKIRFAFDNYEGWIDHKQYQAIDKNSYNALQNKTIYLSKGLINFVLDSNDNFHLIPMGSNLNSLSLINHKFNGESISPKATKNQLINTAFLYLNTPYLWGGKTPFGIDCSGFTQMVYKLNGYILPRDASQQARKGNTIRFIEESMPGDLAFFDNTEGHITHVGIIMKGQYVIHAHGKVRVDRLDERGIYNMERKQYTHRLKLIKAIN